jgi:hypothetical protein
MSLGHEHHDAADGHDHAHHGPRTLPAVLTAPDAVNTWRTRLLIVAVVFGLLSLAFAFSHEGKNHLLRAYLMAYMTCFGFAGGGLAMLMLQYVSGGKWGLLLRRPLEAMSRTLPLVALMLVPILLFAKHLYQWAAFPNVDAAHEGFKNGFVTKEQMLCLISKYRMLTPAKVWGE